MPDQLLPQPPPDAPAPPPGEKALLSKRKMKWLIAVGVGSILLLPAVGWVSTHPLFRKRTICDQTEAINNARQIGMALFEFESEYGRYPESSTVAEVKLKGGSLLTLGGHSSNDLFAQLFASGIANSETMFYLKSKSTKKPDEIRNSDATVLAHGECGFAYICGIDTAGSPDTPLIFGPVIPGTTTLDGKSNDGKAAVLKMDNSVTTLPINSAGKIIYRGMDLLDPRQPFWHGKAPDVRWPK